MSRAPVLIWDAPTRVIHWLLVLCFAGAYLTREADELRTVHVTLGLSLFGLILFRLFWGLVGTRHARFADFAYGPRAVAAYLRSLRGPQPLHYSGHNPAGSWAIYALLACGLGIGLSGLARYNAIGGEAFEEVHEVLGNVALALVGVHLMGVIAGSLKHRENLTRAMITGYKLGEPADAIASARAWVGAVVVAVVVAFWLDAFGVREALIGDPAERLEAGDTQAGEDDDAS